MYIQITDHCNMACAHCCYSCSPRKKNFMSTSLFKATVNLAGVYGENIVIGGGEPTTHPKFWEIFGLSLSNPNVEYVWMATNGKIGNIAIALAGLSIGSEKFGVALSQDCYHEPINPKTVEFFQRAKLEIRNVSNRIIAAGRAKKTMTWQKVGCACEEITVDPNGNIWSCGCKKLLLGHVLSDKMETLERYMRGHDDLIYSHGECLFADPLPHNKRIVKWIKTGGVA